MRGAIIRLAICCATLLASGCTTPPTAMTSSGQWSGRLSLQLESDPPQGFHAGFELRGSPRAGELELHTPLGSTLALASWNEQTALLQRGDAWHAYPDLAALSAALTGTALPVAELFEWLQGRAVPTPGWEVELDADHGRLRARRSDPAPPATLRIVLDRP